MVEFSRTKSNRVGLWVNGLFRSNPAGPVHTRGSDAPERRRQPKLGTTAAVERQPARIGIGLRDDGCHGGEHGSTWDGWRWPELGWEIRQTRRWRPEVIPVNGGEADRPMEKLDGISGKEIVGSTEATADGNYQNLTEKMENGGGGGIREWRFRRHKSDARVPVDSSENRWRGSELQ